MALKNNTLEAKDVKKTVIEVPKGFVAVKAPCGSCSHSGTIYNADDNGIMVMPLEAWDVLRNHQGFELAEKDE